MRNGHESGPKEKESADVPGKFDFEEAEVLDISCQDFPAETEAASGMESEAGEVLSSAADAHREGEKHPSK